MLIRGSIVTVMLVGMHAVEDNGVQMFDVGLASSVIALHLYLAFLLRYPFWGEMSVSRRPFQTDIDMFDGVYDAVPAHESKKLAAND